MLNIVGHKKIWFTISGILVGAAVLAIILFGFRESAEFKGGTLWEFSITPVAATSSVTTNVAPVAQTDIQTFFASKLGVQDAQVSSEGNGQPKFIATFGVVTEAQHQQFLTSLKNQWPSFQELSFQSIGPSVGASLKKNALIALALVIVGISLYIAYAFRKSSKPVSSWKYGWITLLTLFHDVSIPAGLLAFLGRYHGVEIDSNFIVALLVVMGFSVHDTIVVFDRIRENLALRRNKEKFNEIVNDSVNQTMARSINTSLTLILVLLALYFAGPTDLKYFVLTLLVGVITGIYSSIFIASPALVVVSPKE